MSIKKKAVENESELALKPEEIAEYDDIQNEIKRLTTRKDEIASKIKSQFQPGNYEVESFLIDLTQTIGTLKKPVFVHEFPASEFPELYELTPSTEAIKEYLGDERAEYYNPVLRLSIKAKSTK